MHAAAHRRMVRLLHGLKDDTEEDEEADQDAEDQDHGSALVDPQADVGSIMQSLTKVCLLASIECPKSHVGGNQPCQSLRLLPCILLLQYFDE